MLLMISAAAFLAGLFILIVENRHRVGPVVARAMLLAYVVLAAVNALFAADALSRGEGAMLDLVLAAFFTSLAVAEHRRRNRRPEQNGS